VGESATHRPAAAQPGRILGRCRLEREIGQGAMGVVWKAHHLTLDIPVAVKVLRDPSASDGSQRFLERFRREARIAARLNHPSLVRVLDFGEEGGSPFLVMELVDGQTLETWLERRGPIPERIALRVLSHLCAALAAAHEAGIVHRDVKPANILLDREGRLRLSDLGLAREEASPAFTAADGVVGTPHYIAPETLDAPGTASARSDLYSAGVLLYRMVWGHPPFQGNTSQILHGHLLGTPSWERPDGTLPDPGVLALVRRLLEKKPERRPPSAAAVIEACRLVLARIDGSGSRIPTESGSSSELRLRKALASGLGSTTSLQDGKRIVHTTGRERLLVWGMLSGLLAMALAALLLR
jgi:serine/threonine protein kinase